MYISSSTKKKWKILFSTKRLLYLSKNIFNTSVFILSNSSNTNMIFILFNCLIIFKISFILSRSILFNDIYEFILLLVSFISSFSKLSSPLTLTSDKITVFKAIPIFENIDTFSFLVCFISLFVISDLSIRSSIEYNNLILYCFKSSDNCSLLAS